MGCCSSSETGATKDSKNRGLKKPVWTSEEPITGSKLQAMREEFWDTAPHYGGDRVIWDALKAATETQDYETALLILESAGVLVHNNDLAVTYDERGAKYELPKYVLSAPVNLMKENKKRTDQSSEVELPAR